MATDRLNDLHAFRGFLDEQLSVAGPDLTLEEVLILWEDENPPEDDREETIRTVRQGLADLEAGRVQSVQDSDREFRRNHGLRPRL